MAIFSISEPISLAFFIILNIYYIFDDPSLVSQYYITNEVKK